MCLAVPGKIVELRGGKALVSSCGWFHEVDVTHVQAAPGDFVLVQGSRAVLVLDPREAAEAMVRHALR